MKDLITTILSSIFLFVLTGCYTQLEISDQTKEMIYNQNCQYERIYIQTEFGLVKRYQKVCRTLSYQSYFHNYRHRYHRPLKEKREKRNHRPRKSTIGRSPSKEDARKRGRNRSNNEKE